MGNLTSKLRSSRVMVNIVNSPTGRIPKFPSIGQRTELLLSQEACVPWHVWVMPRGLACDAIYEIDLSLRRRFPVKVLRSLRAMN